MIVYLVQTEPYTGVHQISPTHALITPLEREGLYTVCGFSLSATTHPWHVALMLDDRPDCKHCRVKLAKR